MSDPCELTEEVAALREELEALRAEHQNLREQHNQLQVAETRWRAEAKELRRQIARLDDRTFGMAPPLK